MHGGKPHQIQPVTLNLMHQLQLLPPERGDIPHPQSQPLQPRSGSPRPVTTTATQVAAQSTSAVRPADGGSTGWERVKCHVALSGFARPGPGHQALAHGPSVQAWLRMRAPGFLRAGSLASHLYFPWGILNHT